VAPTDDRLPAGIVGVTGGRSLEARISDEPLSVDDPWLLLAAGKATADGPHSQEDRSVSVRYRGGEHHNRVLERLQGVPLRRDDQQVTFMTLPAGAARAQ